MRIVSFAQNGGKNMLFGMPCKSGEKQYIEFHVSAEKHKFETHSDLRKHLTNNMQIIRTIPESELIEQIRSHIKSKKVTIEAALTHFEISELDREHLTAKIIQMNSL